MNSAAEILLATALYCTCSACCEHEVKQTIPADPGDKDFCSGWSEPPSGELASEFVFSVLKYIIT